MPTPHPLSEFFLVSNPVSQVTTGITSAISFKTVGLVIVLLVAFTAIAYFGFSPEANAARIRQKVAA